MTSSSYTLGFVGMGKMAAAMLEGIVASGLFLPSQIGFYELNAARRDEISASSKIIFYDVEALIAQSDILLFCVKPQNIRELLASFPKIDLSQKLLISILAGTPIAVFEQQLGTHVQVLRVMPNTPALLQAGMSALTFNANVSPEFRKTGYAVFNCLGRSVEVDESDMDVVTGISGSGPAFLYRLAHDIAKTGEQEGVDYTKSLTLIAQTMIGAGRMLLDSQKTPLELISDVSSPNGTTVAGLQAFDQSRIDTDIQSVILAAVHRSRELSKGGV